MHHLVRLASAGTLFGLLSAFPAAAQNAAQPAQPEAVVQPTTIRLGRPFLEVIRRYGQPSRVRTGELVPLADGKAQPVVQWIYHRPMDQTVEFLFGEDGKLLQMTTRSKLLDEYRLELRH